MTTGAVGMPVLDLFVRCISKRLDGHLEVQGLASKWVIWIDRNRFFGDARDEERDLPALIIVRDDLHARRSLRVRGKQVARHFLGLSDPWAVSLLGRHRRFDRLALGNALELLLEPRNDVSCAMQIKKRAPILGLIDELAIVVTQGVRG